jgi:hypothetical protein
MLADDVCYYFRGDNLMKPNTKKPKQFGGFLTNVLGVAGVVFAGFLIIYPFLQKKGVVSQKEAVISAEDAQVKGIAPPVPARTGSKPIGTGIVLEATASEAGRALGLMRMVCDAKSPLAETGGLNYDCYTQGTSCSIDFSVLCYKADGVDRGDAQRYNATAGQISGNLGATQAIAGTQLGSLANASALCAKALGADWRMAELTDVHAGGLGGKGLPATGLRQGASYWVHNKNPQKNCWDAQE